MLFNSYQFLIFFPVVTLLYFLLPHKFRWLHLLAASCFFYMSFIPVYILILFFTIIIDYFAGILIESHSGPHKKKYLIASLVANIGVLAVFKYYNFFIDNSNQLLAHFGFTACHLPYLSILLPIGLSFHTFQAMSYTIEVYRGHQKAERHMGIYALYVMFYPQLVAGPIERPQNLLHQFREYHPFDSQKLLEGLRLMAWGFFKKIVIADRLSLYVNAVYNHPDDYHYLNLLIATLFFSIQIYCDFSGYSDIAIGAARTMGFHLMTNFNRPYFSKNIQEFWKRWHISLSTWFKDYLYISLGGNRKGLKRMYFNLSVVFLLSGLWHGANWTFIIWGALHTLYIISYLIIKNHSKIKWPGFVNSRLPGMLFTFILTTLAWVFFRANNVHDANTIISHILTMDTKNAFVSVVQSASSIEFGPSSFVIALSMICLMFVFERLVPANLFSLNKKPLTDIIFLSFISVLIISLGVFYNNSFIYFQF
ncbi:MAG TPA: MBOAT family O-acyltransferase [Bacteroidia bacterium]|nr:MBOAT family O-acyltransferase [Bacteroidia bacterium]